MPHTSLLFTCALFALFAAAHGSSVNGMDMSMDNGITLANGTGMGTLHFTPISDNIWFPGWAPQSSGALFGACFGLFLLAIVERFISAVRGMYEGLWRREGIRMMIEQEKAAAEKRGQSQIKPKKTGLAAMVARAPPFVPAHDLTRGLMQAVQALIGFLFMLTVMSYSVSYLLAIVIGLGVGEAIFGRYAGGALAGAGHL
ncbi:unnamed protein product [Mycena citricolor]|uniref:Copper transport protein n=1 Tax=Mycena citricolor TaxID=2018698 RepID=A0AAD2HJ03_9AGAR|nr:unnamed protein product [Mycena citricolor]